MAQYSTIQEFKQNHPESEECMQFVCIDKTDGAIMQIYIPIELWHAEIRGIMTSYAFVNDWFVYTNTIKVF